MAHRLKLIRRGKQTDDEVQESSQVIGRIDATGLVSTSDGHLQKRRYAERGEDGFGSSNVILYHSHSLNGGDINLGHFHDARLGSR